MFVVSVSWLQIGWVMERVLLKLLAVYSFYHLWLRIRFLILTDIVTQIVLHILVLVLFLKRFYRCRKVDFGLEKLVGRNFVLRFELKLVLGVNVHFLIHHLRQLLCHHVIEICKTLLPRPVIIIPFWHIFVFVIVWNISLRILLSIILYDVLFILMVIIASVLKLLTIYSWFC